MSILQLYKPYFQKSKAFLYPTLGIKKGAYTSPIQTFIAWKDRVLPTERKLLCLYDTTSSGFNRFERDVLHKISSFVERITVAEGRSVYVYSFDEYRTDWNAFLDGRYSQLGVKLRQQIRNYFGTSTPEYAYMESFLLPERYYYRYAELLYCDRERNKGYEELRTIGELCNRFDLEKETLTI